LSSRTGLILVKLPLIQIIAVEEKIETSII